MPLNSSQNSNMTISETYFDIIDFLTKRFPSLSPFELLNTPTSEVFELYVDAVIHDVKERKQEKKEKEVWVTSKTASWH